MPGPTHTLTRETIQNVRIAALISPQARLQHKFDLKGGDGFFGPIDRTDGTAWYYRGGSCIVDNPDIMEAFEIHGAIYQKWVELGGVRFGIPTTDETVTPDGVGRYNHFNGNSASIYWTPSTGAHVIYGDIHARWAALGWELSYLGYPTSDETDFPEGGRANSFQNGGIYWWPDLGAIDLRGVIVHYAGLHCFGETDWDQGSDSDEPYFILSVSTPQMAATTVAQTYADVDGGETFPDLLEIYRGQPYGINIGAVLMEHDFGDQNKYRKEVQDIVMGVHTAGTIALGLIPVVGPAIAAVAGPALGSLMPSIGEAINDLFDEGDDRIGGANLTIGARQMVILATRTGNSQFNGIGFKVETSLISGSGASYKGYFGIVPA